MIQMRKQSELEKLRARDVKELKNAPSLELKVPPGGYGVHNHDIVRKEC